MNSIRQSIQALVAAGAVLITAPLAAQSAGQTLCSLYERSVLAHEYFDEELGAHREVLEGPTGTRLAQRIPVLEQQAKDNYQFCSALPTPEQRAQCRNQDMAGTLHLWSGSVAIAMTYDTPWGQTPFGVQFADSQRQCRMLASPAVCEDFIRTALPVMRPFCELAFR